MSATAGILTAAAVLLGAVALLGHQLGRAHDHIVEHIDRQINHLRKVIAVTSQDTVNAAVAQIRKGTGEVLARISDLQAQVEAAGVAEQIDLTSLTEAAQALDDIVPDAAEVPEEVPAEVTDAELPAEVTGDPAE